MKLALVISILVAVLGWVLYLTRSGILPGSWFSGLFSSNKKNNLLPSTSQKYQQDLLEAVKQIGDLLTGVQSLDITLDRLLVLLEQLLDFDSATIFLMDDNREVYLAASRGIDDLESVKQSLADHTEKFLPRYWEGEKTIYYQDTREVEEWFLIPETSYIRSWIGAALMIKDRYIGFLNVDSSQVDAYSPFDIKLTRAFADQAAAAIDNASLMESKTKTTHRLQVLYDLNEKLASTLDSIIIIDHTLALAQEAVGGDKVDFYRFFPDQEQIRLEQSLGRTKSEIEKINYYLSFGENKSDIGWVLDNRETLRIPSVHDHKLWVELPNLDAEIQSLITVPIRIGNQYGGALSILDCERDAFSDNQQDLLEAIAHQVGLALNNAQRYIDTAFLLNSIKAKQELQDKLLEYLPIGILLLDSEFRILSGNQKGIKYVKELASEPESEKISALGDKSVQELIQHTKDPLPVPIRKKASSQGLYEVQLRQVDTVEGRYWILIVADVTKERMITKRMQVQERMATIGQFAAGMAHDFNNIMSAILVYSDVVIKDQSLSRKNRSRVNVIKEQSQRAANLISQILDFSRHSTLEMEIFDLIPFLEDVKALLTRVLPEYILIKLNLPVNQDSLPMYGDKTRIQQMIMNLAVNARDAMPEGGEIKIGLSTYHLSVYDAVPFPKMEPGKWIYLTVQDQGIGISDQDQSRIFDPFFTTKQTQDGTGLGLSQVYGIIKQHHGYIDLDSKLGEGTTFKIYFPWVDEKPLSERSPDQAIQLDGAGRVVLVVEDDFSLRNALWNILEEYNFQVILAPDGQKGFNIIRQIGEKLSLVITDIVMPNMGGKELYRKTRELFPPLDFLFITGHPSQIVDQNIENDQHARQLQKPFSLQDILELVSEMCPPHHPEQDQE